MRGEHIGTRIAYCVLAATLGFICISTLVGIGQYMPQRSHDATDFMKEVYWGIGRGMQRVPLSEGGRGGSGKRRHWLFFYKGPEHIGIERILEP